MHNDSSSQSSLLVRLVGVAVLVAGCNSDERSPGQSGSASASDSAAEDSATDSNSNSDGNDGSGSDDDGGSNSDSLSGTTGEPTGGDSLSAGDDSDTDGESDGATGGEGGTPCPTDDPLCNIPDADREPVDVPDGLPSPLPGVYDQPETAAGDQEFRALIGFPVRDPGGLEDRLKDMTDPNDVAFGNHMTVDEFMKEHAPTAAEFTLVQTWLTTRGFTVDFAATNRLLVQFSGTVAQFNETFDETLLICQRKNPAAGLPAYPVYCTATDSLSLPKFIADITRGVVAADLPAEKGELPGEGGGIVDDHPGEGAYDPHQIAVAYGLQPLYDAGFTGQGVTLGVIAAATFHGKDMQTFYKSFDIEREAPIRVQVMEPVVTRITETIRDVQWASVLAPGAAVKVYEGPDARNTALLYTFNEAIARAEVDVLTDSFDHREDSEPAPLRHQYDESAMMGAALGITIVGASGNSAKPDIPCSSPHVTCVGGTDLEADENGQVLSETAWKYSGSGDTRSFEVPWWQQDVAPKDTRAVCDVALNASEEHPYWLRRYGEWEYTHGTSISAPVFAAIIAVIDSARLTQNKRRVGFLNPVLYLDAAVRGSFRDITEGATEFHAAGEGWDYPTGWGAPHAKNLHDALP